MSRQPDGRLKRALTEIALRELVLPVLKNLKEIFSTKKRQVTADPVQEGGKKKRARVESPGDDDGGSCGNSSSVSSSSSSSSSSIANDKSPLLVENCAVERAELVLLKHSLYIARKEVESF